jgi:hypothetical protein
MKINVEKDPSIFLGFYISTNLDLVPTSETLIPLGILILV